MMTDQEKIDNLEARVEAWCIINQDIDPDTLITNIEFTALVDELMTLEEDLLFVMLGKVLSITDPNSAIRILDDNI
jgi:hypothetical protein